MSSSPSSTPVASAPGRVPAAILRLPRWLPAPVATCALLLAVPWIEPYLANTIASWLIAGLLGLSLALVWGQMGFLSLGQTALYGLGGYAGSVLAINLAPGLGNPLLLAAPFGALVGALAAAGIGWVVFYGRLGQLQGTILTYTCTLILWTASVSLNTGIGRARVGGDNGMSDIPGFVAGLGLDAPPMTPNQTLACVLVVCALVYLGCRWLMASSFGRVVQGIRHSAEKTELLGYDTRRFQLMLFAVSGAIAGLAGTLYAAWGAYISPSIFSAQEALLVPIYVLAGGIGSLAGAFLGAVLVGALSFWLGGGAAGGQATLILGLCLIALVLFAPRGLAGMAGSIARGLARQRMPSAVNATALQHASVNAEGLARIASAGPPRGRVAFDATALIKRFGGIVPVNAVSRSFAEGHAAALIGPNGAGKSSFLRCCSGQYRLDGGTITIDGRDVTRWPLFRRVQAGAGIKTQAPLVYAELSVHENLWIAAHRVARDARQAAVAADEALAAMGLQAVARLPAGSLPHGGRQWLDIAMVLIQRPRIVFLDEPAAGMSGEERRALARLLATLGSTLAVVVVEHDMEFVKQLGGHVSVLHQGQLFAEGSIDALRADERVLDIYLGRKAHVQAH